MIITVTMNPAIDRTIYPTHERIDVGGKGINVSKTLASFGQDSIATGFLGGDSGNYIRQNLPSGVTDAFVWIQNDTRTNRKIADENGSITEQNEPGPVISQAEQQELCDKILQYAVPGNLFVLSGSLPCGVPTDYYATLIHRLHERGALVMLDASKEALQAGIQAGPDYCKPNEEEFLSLFRLTEFPELETYLEQLYSLGIQNVIISRGDKGACFCSKERGVQYYEPLSVPVQSTVGAGDAMTAGFIYRKSLGASEEDCESFAVAAATGAVTTQGTRPAELQTVLNFQKEIVKKTGWSIEK